MAVPLESQQGITKKAIVLPRNYVAALRLLSGVTCVEALLQGQSANFYKGWVPRIARQ